MPTNAERADRIDYVLNAYCQLVDGCDHDGSMTYLEDLLTDIMHYCYQMNYNFDKRLQWASNNYEAEIDDEQEAA